MKKLLWWTPVLLIACSKPAPRDTPVRVEPTSAARVVSVVGTPTVSAKSIAAPIVPTSSPTAAFQSAEFVVRLPTASPTVDVGPIPNMDRQKPPAPDSLTDQMKQCLSYSVSATHPMIIGGTPGQQLSVRVVNSCDVTFSAADSSFEARGRSSDGSVLGREIGRFQQDIRAHGSAETLIQLDNCCSDRRGVTYEASVWWAAGGGKKPGE